MAASEQEVRERLIRARLSAANQQFRFRPVSPEQREAGANLSQLARETEHPVLVGFDAGITDIMNGMKRLGIAGTAALNNWTVSPNGTKFKDLVPIFAGIDMEDYERLSQEHANERELFEELAKRSPAARNAHFFTTLGMMLTPVGRRPTRMAAEGPTVGSEMLAGGMAGASMPSEDIGQQVGNTLGGMFAGGIIHHLGTAVSAAGTLIVGGRPATIQRAEDLLRAERDLNAIGLLTPAELTGGRSLARIEGVLDNVPFIGLQAKRGEQQGLFANAVATIRAAFPETTPEQAVSLISARLNRNIDESNRLFQRVSDVVPADADTVPVVNYVTTAQRLLDEELAKGARADQRTVDYLRAQSEVESVPFEAARAISSDLGARVRVADRAATDPAAIGIDAGRLKQLSMAHFKDMELWARQTGGETMEAWAAAKTFWKENVLPFQKRPLAPIFDEGYDSIKFAQFLTDPAKAGKLAELDETGALGFLLVNDAIERSTQANGVVDVRGMIAILNRHRTNQSLERLVPDESMELLIGLSKLTEAAPRAFIRPGANVLATTAGSAALIGGSMAVSDNPYIQAGTGFASLATIRWLIGSRGGRAILAAAAHTQPSNRKQLAQLAMSARLLVQRTSTLAATEAGQQAETVIRGLGE